MALYPIDSDGVLAKIEATYGTDPTPVPATDYVRIAQRMWNNISFEHQFENLRDTTASGVNTPTAPALPRGRVVTLNLYVEQRGSGAVDTPPEWDPLHQACGNDQTVNAAADVQYDWNTDPDAHGSCTIYAYSGGKQFIVTGCYGNVEWIVTGGEVTILHYTMQGIMVASPTEVAVPSITYGAVLPPPAVGVTATLDAIEMDFTQITFDQGNEVVRLASPNSSIGIDGLRIALPRQVPIVTANLKLDAIATFSAWADERARTSRAINLVVGTAGGERLTLDVDSAYVLSPATEDQDGFAGSVLTLRCLDYLWTHD